MAEEGVAEAAPVVGGGADSLVAGAEEAGVVEAAEAAEGEIIAMMAAQTSSTSQRKPSALSECGRGKSQPSPSQTPHHVHMKMQWPPQHLTSKKGLSFEGWGLQ
jgi:hypothetical protein